MGWGFVLITLAVLMGSIWGFIESGTAWVSDPKIVVAWATWLGYLVMVFLRVSAGWRGRKAAVMALSVLGFSVLTWAAHVGIRESLLR
jgi:ABC-type transport system involved in cytochrome c biogenesis permease subunit